MYVIDMCRGECLYEEDIPFKESNNVKFVLDKTLGKLSEEGILFKEVPTKYIEKELREDKKSRALLQEIKGTTNISYKICLGNSKDLEYNLGIYVLEKLTKKEDLLFKINQTRRFRYKIVVSEGKILLSVATQGINTVKTFKADVKGNSKEEFKIVNKNDHHKGKVKLEKLSVREETALIAERMTVDKGSNGGVTLEVLGDGGTTSDYMKILESSENMKEFVRKKAKMLWEEMLDSIKNSVFMN